MRSIRPVRPTFGEALLAAFASRLAEQGLSPVTVRGYRHDLERFRRGIEADRASVPPKVYTGKRQNRMLRFFVDKYPVRIESESHNVALLLHR